MKDRGVPIHENKNHLTFQQCNCVSKRNLHTVATLFSQTQFMNIYYTIKSFPREFSKSRLITSRTNYRGKTISSFAISSIISNAYTFERARHLPGWCNSRSYRAGVHAGRYIYDGVVSSWDSSLEKSSGGGKSRVNVRLRGENRRGGINRGADFALRIFAQPLSRE